MLLACFHAQVVQIWQPLPLPFTAESGAKVHDEVVTQHCTTVSQHKPSF